MYLVYILSEEISTKYIILPKRLWHLRYPKNKKVNHVLTWNKKKYISDLTIAEHQCKLMLSTKIEKTRCDICQSTQVYWNEYDVICQLMTDKCHLRSVSPLLPRAL